MWTRDGKSPRQCGRREGRRGYAGVLGKGVTVVGSVEVSRPEDPPASPLGPADRSDAAGSAPPDPAAPGARSAVSEHGGTGDRPGVDGGADEPVRRRKPVVQAARWTVASTLIRQGLQIGGAVLLARILGPQTYGLISIATLFTVIANLILDQGLASALIQKPVVGRTLPGAVATLNLAMAAVLATLTWVFAPWVADFFGAPDLPPLLRILAVGLLVKAAAIVPRAMLMRDLDFRVIGRSDIAGAVVGTTAGVTSAFLGAGAYSFVILTIATDLTILVFLLIGGPAHVPNTKLGQVVEILPFSLRIFGTNVIAAFSRNTDNVLVGRYLGVTQLSFYAMAYRVLVLPVQLIGQTAARFMFPLLAGEARDTAALGRYMISCSRVLAAVTVPAMVWVSCAAQQLVLIVLGPAWQTTAAIMSILALAGAREAIYYITPSLMKATGRAALNLRFELVSTVIQVTGIVIGLQFGLIGVAAGYAIAGLAVTPILIVVQKRLAGLSVGRQLWAITPPIIGSAVAAAGYLAVALMTGSVWSTLLGGTAAYLALFVLMTLPFPGWRRDVLSFGRRFLRRRAAKS